MHECFSHTLPPLGRYAPSGLVASLPRKDCAPQMFWLITPLGTSDTLSQKHIYIYFQVWNYTCRQFPFITYGMALYINASIPTKH